MLQDLFAAPAARSVRVALPVAVDRLFEYAVPDALAAEAEPGRRARVPFESRRLVGVIVEAPATPSDPARPLRPLDAVLDPAPVLPAAWLGILREEARRCLCPVGIALAAALPPGARPQPAERIALTARGRAALASGALRGEDRELAAALEKRPLGLRTLAGRFPGARDRLAALERDGLVARGPADAGPARRARASASGEPGAGLREEDVRVSLTPEQAAALDAIVAAVRARRPDRFLLHGVTGSGKTEVYLRAVDAALGLGRQALVLVPEITLTHQIVARLRARFGDRVAVLHSGLRPVERRAQWERLRAGATPIAVGARSALFAPLADLGLVVIDEEHDAAYKNEEGFRYHARELAGRRAAAAGAPVVLGSATPSLETRYAAERGEIARLVLPRRIGGRPLPAVELVDLEKERALVPRGRKLLLSPSLQRAMRQTLEAGGQTILFLNRRGFSTQILCFECQHVERCKHCDISLVYHASQSLLRCHYCDYRVAPPETCSKCGAPDTALLGVGTERVVEEVRRQLPQARVARLDRDTGRGRGVTEALLRDLAEGRVDVLVGTQMVAKGHDFPGVRLVGVVNADQSLHFPDFRAAERTFQILTQVAGRAGRGPTPGRVVVQTYLPDHYAIRPVVDHDYETFYRTELRERAALGYPPTGELAHAVVSGAEADEAEAGARRLAREIAEPSAAAGVEVLGPAPAPLARLRGRHRFQILLKGRDRDAVHAAAARLLDAAARLPRGLRVTVDVAPVNMM
jgi:primosomal protein N' (replication factor Y)